MTGRRAEVSPVLAALADAGERYISTPFVRVLS